VEQERFSLGSRHFRLSDKRPEKDDARKRNWQCVADFLREHGVTEFEPYSERGDLHAEATFAQIRPALDLALVLDIEPGCRTESSCLHCTTLGEADCQPDPFCMPIAAAPLDPERTCLGPTQFFGCQHQDRGCPGVIFFGADASGRCWQSGGCGPGGLTPQDRCQPKKGAPPFPICAP
jgi:hypothetical protein